MEESTTLFLGDLSVFCTEKDIRKLFRPFGPIEAIRVKRGAYSKTNLSYGFIKFVERESAKNAFFHLNGVMFLGRALRIGWAEGKGGMNSLREGMTAPKKAETAQIHVSFISKQVDLLISEATLRRLFGVYGQVVDVALKKSQFDKNLCVQNGYGFVHFAFTPDGIRSALTAVQCLHQVTIDRVTYDCSISYALQQYLKAANDPTLVPSRMTHPEPPVSAPNPSFSNPMTNSNPYATISTMQSQINRPVVGESGMDVRYDPYLDSHSIPIPYQSDYRSAHQRLDYDNPAPMWPQMNFPRGGMEPSMRPLYQDLPGQEHRMDSFGKGNLYDPLPNAYDSLSIQHPSSNNHSRIRPFSGQSNYGDDYSHNGAGPMAPALALTPVGMGQTLPDRYNNSYSSPHQYGLHAIGSVGSQPGSATSLESVLEPSEGFSRRAGGSRFPLSLRSRGMGPGYSDFLSEDDLSTRVGSSGSNIPYLSSLSNTVRSHSSSSSQSSQEPRLGPPTGNGTYPSEGFALDSPPMRKPSTFLSSTNHLILEDEITSGLQRLDVDGSNLSSKSDSPYGDGYYQITLPSDRGTSEVSSSTGSTFNLRSSSSYVISSTLDMQIQGSVDITARHKQHSDNFMPSCSSSAVQCLSSASGSCGDLLTISNDISESENKYLASTVSCSTGVHT